MQLGERFTLEYQNILYEEYFRLKKINIHEDLTPPQNPVSLFKIQNCMEESV